MASAQPAEQPVEEITSLDDLRRVANEVQTAKRPRLVSIPGGGEITLAPPRRKRRRPTPEERAKADEETFRSTFGALAGEFDLDEFMRRVREGRSSGRPPVVFDKPLE